MKAIQSTQEDTTKSINSIKEKISEIGSSQTTEKRRYIGPLVETVDKLKGDQAKLVERISSVEESQKQIQSQLIVMTTTLQLIIEALIPDTADVKKGDKVVSSKCKPDQTLKKDDDAGDGGSGSRRQIRRNKGGAGQQTTKFDAPRNFVQSSSREGHQLKSYLPLTDEEVAMQAYLEENKGADVEALRAEEERLAEEHKKNLALKR